METNLPVEEGARPVLALSLGLHLGAPSELLHSRPVLADWFPIMSTAQVAGVFTLHCRLASPNCKVVICLCGRFRPFPT